jgi:hypothetical protein
MKFLIDEYELNMCKTPLNHENEQTCHPEEQRDEGFQPASSIWAGVDPAAEAPEFLRFAQDDILVHFSNLQYVKPMIHSYKKVLTAVFLFVISASFGFSWTFGHRGIISLWGMSGLQKSSQPQLGLRYIPEFTLTVQPSESLTLDSELSAHAFGTARFKQIDELETSGDIKPYRMWLRFSLSQFEVRAGLQKINFGSASLLRPLMWFDRLDPRDPLQITDGVYALLLRYYFINNTNIWVWGLYGNDDPKGRESFPTQDDSVEYGGRLQVPLFKGEIAAAYHHRRADIQNPAMAPFLQEPQTAPEDRYALDGKWDIGIGLWFEGTLTRQQHPLLTLPWQRAWSTGLDYTFDIGNGLYLLGEYYKLARTEEAFASGEDINFSSMLLRYPLGLLDEINGIFYYDWENEEWYRFISWQRTYDKWRINVIGFWNPENFQIYPSASGANFFVGNGFQVTIIFNY